MNYKKHIEKVIEFTSSFELRIKQYDLNSNTLQQVLETGKKAAVLAVDAHDTKELIACGGMASGTPKSVQFWAPQDELGYLPVASDKQRKQ